MVFIKLMCEYGCVCFEIHTASRKIVHHGVCLSTYSVSWSQILKWMHSTIKRCSLQSRLLPQCLKLSRIARTYSVVWIQSAAVVAREEWSRTRLDIGASLRPVRSQSVPVALGYGTIYVSLSKPHPLPGFTYL